MVFISEHHLLVDLRTSLIGSNLQMKASLWTLSQDGFAG